MKALIWIGCLLVGSFIVGILNAAGLHSPWLICVAGIVEIFAARSLCKSLDERRATKTSTSTSYYGRLEKLVGKKKFKELSAEEIRSEKLYYGQLLDEKELGLKETSPVVIPTSMSIDEYLGRLKTSNNDRISWKSEGCRAIENVYSIDYIIVYKYKVGVRDESSIYVYICKVDFKDDRNIFAPAGFVYPYTPAPSEKNAGEENENLVVRENEQSHSVELPVVAGMLFDQSTSIQSSQASDEYDRALSLMSIPSHDNISAAIAAMTDLAEKSDYLPAARWLGEYYASVVNDYKRAIEWYKKAAQIEEYQSE